MRRYYVLGVLVLVVGVVVLTVVLLSTGGGGTPTDADDVSATTTSTAFPYDFVEAADTVDVEALQGAKFASLTLVTADGLESYLLTPDNPGFGVLTKAMAEAEEARHEPAPGETAPGSAAGSTIPANSGAVIPGVTVSSLTYVMDDRSTYTLVVNVEDDVLYRGTQEWRLREDLAALIQTATADAEK